MFLLEFKAVGLQFLNLNCYIPGSLEALAKQYEICYDPIYFPSVLNIPKNYDLETIPHLVWFLQFVDSPEVKEKKEAFVKMFEINNYKWEFKKQLIDFADQKCFLLTAATTTFIKNCYQMQIDITSDLSINYSLINPFGHNLSTFAGYIYKLFRLFYLNSEPIFIVKNEYGTPCRNVSKDEYEWAEFMCFEFPEKEFRHAFNHFNGQKYYKEAIPDLLSVKFGEAHFFSGALNIYYFCI